MTVLGARQQKDALGNQRQTLFTHRTAFIAAPSPMEAAMGGDDFPDKIQVWRSTATLEYCGTWSTTRYPKDAVTYRRVLPAAPAEDVRAGALKEAEKALRDWQDILNAQRMPETAVTIGMAADVVAALIPGAKT